MTYPPVGLSDGLRIGGGLSAANVLSAGAIGLLIYLVVGSVLYPPKGSRTPPPPAGAGTFMR
jgi:hypothetical protein